MINAAKILPGTGRGTSRRLVEGERHEAQRLRPAPSTPAFGGGPPPHTGEDNLSLCLATLARLAAPVRRIIGSAT